MDDLDDLSFNKLSNKIQRILDTHLFFHIESIT